MGKPGCDQHGCTNEASLATQLSTQCPFVIKAPIFEGNGKNAIRERHTFTGSVLRQLDQASALLNGINESGQYPAIALREALVNALEHRDYTYSGPTLINIFDSRLEIVSLGGLTDGLEINDLLNGVCQPRTPRLAELFADLGLCENCGTPVCPSYKNVPRPAAHIYFLPHRGKKHNLRLCRGYNRREAAI